MPFAVPHTRNPVSPRPLPPAQRVYWLNEEFETNLNPYTLTGTPTLSAAAALFGATGLLITGAGSQRISIQPDGGSPTVSVQRCYFRVPVGGTPVTAAMNVVFATTVSAANYFIRVNTNGHLEAVASGGTTQTWTGVTIVEGTIYRLDMRCDASRGTLDWQVDGVDQTQATGTAGSNFGTANGTRAGNTNAGVTAGTMHIDVWKVSNDPTVYPIGPYGVPAPITDITILPPAATATAAALVPVIEADILPPVATATAQALTPAILATILPAAATATAAALLPTVKVDILPPVATATAAALVPTVMVTIVPAAATATAQALVPTIINPQPITILPPAATATAQALAPTIMATILPAAATATAAALVPTVKATILPAAATATAAALVPTIKVTILPAAATATAQALAPLIIIGPVTITPPAATATAQALVPTIKVTIIPSAATATAAALVPTISGVSAAGVLIFFPPVSSPSRQHGLLPQLHGQYQDVIAVSTVRGRYTFSSSYSTGGETLSIPIQRVVVQVLAAHLAGGKGIVWTGTKLQAWNLDGSGNLTTEVTAGTDLSSVTVPIIAYVIAH